MENRQLFEILSNVMRRSGENFSGVGIIVTDRPEELPLFPLRLSVRDSAIISLEEELINIADKNSEYHDGFHIVSSRWKLTKISQYFSPSILSGISVDHSRKFGGRYMAALFGSALPNVIATGIASRGFGIAVFYAGAEVMFERDI